MIVEGYEIPDELRTAAIAWRLEDPKGFETTQFVGWLMRQGNPEISDIVRPLRYPRAYRLADRIIQQLRVNGDIKRAGKVWIPKT